MFLRSNFYLIRVWKTISPYFLSPGLSVRQMLITTTSRNKQKQKTTKSLLYTAGSMGKRLFGKASFFFSACTSSEETDPLDVGRFWPSKRLELANMLWNLAEGRVCRGHVYNIIPMSCALHPTLKKSIPGAYYLLSQRLYDM